MTPSEKVATSQNETQLAGSIRKQIHRVPSSAIVSCILTGHDLCEEIGWFYCSLARMIPSPSMYKSYFMRCSNLLSNFHHLPLLVRVSLSIFALCLFDCLLYPPLSLPPLPTSLPPAYLCLSPIPPPWLFLPLLTTASSSLSHPPLHWLCPSLPYTLKVSNCSDSVDPHSYANISIGILLSKLYCGGGEGGRDREGEKGSVGLDCIGRDVWAAE